MRKHIKLKSVFAVAPRADGMLLSLTLAVLVFGWVVLYSASALVAEAKFGDQYFFVAVEQKHARHLNAHQLGDALGQLAEQLVRLFH